MARAKIKGRKETLPITRAAEKRQVTSGLRGLERSQNAEWQSRLEASARYIDDRKWAIWERADSLLTGQQFTKSKSLDQARTGDAVATVINMTYPYVRDKLGDVMDRPVRFMVEDRRTADESMSARHAEAVLNYCWYYGKTKRQARLIVMDQLLYCMGVFFHGINVRKGARYKRINEQGVMEFDTRIQEMVPWSIRVHPRDYIYDHNAQCFEQAQWKARRLILPLDYVKDHPLYKNTDKLTGGKCLRRQYKSAGIVDETGRPMMYSPSQLESDMVELWEVWSRKWTKENDSDSDFRRTVICPGYDYFLLDEDSPYSNLDELPFTEYVVNDDSISPMGHSDVQMFEDQQYQLNIYRSLEFAFHQQNLPKNIYDIQAVADDQTVKKLKSPFSLEWVGVRNVNAFRRLEVHSLGAEFYRGMADSREDLRTIAAYYDVQALKPRTAREAQMVAQQISARAKEKIDLYYDALSDMGRAWLRLASEHMSEDVWLQLSGPDGVSRGGKFSRKLLHNDLGVKVQATSGRMLDEDERLGNLMKLWPLFANFPEVVNRGALAKLILQYADSTGLLDKVLSPTPPEQVQPQPSGLPPPDAGNELPPEPAGNPLMGAGVSAMDPDSAARQLFQQSASSPMEAVGERDIGM